LEIVAKLEGGATYGVASSRVEHPADPEILAQVLAGRNLDVRQDDDYSTLPE
jgi:hypothetical protein